MNKKLMACILLSAILIIFFMLPACSKTVEKDQKEPLLAAFEALQMDEGALHLTGWLLEENSFLPMTDLKARAQVIVKQLGLSVKSESEDDDISWRQFQILGQKENANYLITYQSLPQNTYLIIDIESQGQVASFEGLRYDLDRALGQNGDRIYLIMSTWPGRHTEKEIGNLFDKALTTCGAQKIDAMHDDYYICYTGYIEGVLPESEREGEKVNIQLVADYNKEQDLTYVYLGMPVVFSDY